MEKLHFFAFSDYEDGKLAHMQTTGEHEIPINIFIDNADAYADLSECTCALEVCGVSGNTQIFHSEEAYRAAESKLNVLAMIPAGTFPVTPDDPDFQQSPHILFSGIVRDILMDPEATEEEPNYELLVETFGLSFHLYIHYDGEIYVGDIVHGMAWLFGEIEKVTCATDAKACDKAQEAMCRAKSLITPQSESDGAKKLESLAEKYGMEIVAGSSQSRASFSYKLAKQVIFSLQFLKNKTKVEVYNKKIANFLGDGYSTEQIQALFADCTALAKQAGAVTGGTNTCYTMEFLLQNEAFAAFEKALAAVVELFHLR